MKQVFMLIVALCLLSISCKKDKQPGQYKAVVLQGGNYCGKGTWVKLGKAIPIPSAGTSDVLNVVNLPDNYNVPGKTIEFNFKFDQSVEICDTYHYFYPNVSVFNLK